VKIITVNKKASYNFLISEIYEAGLILTGGEVKSLRINSSSIKESYVIEKNGELWLSNCHIKKYSSSNHIENDSVREKKILVKKKELNKIIGASKKNGMSIIPLKMYFNDRGFAKISIGLGKGKKLHDKRESIKNKEWGLKKQRMLKKRSI
jgi:SsrA-binding protein